MKYFFLSIILLSTVTVFSQTLPKVNVKNLDMLLIKESVVLFVQYPDLCSGCTKKEIKKMHYLDRVAYDAREHLINNVFGNYISKCQIIDEDMLESDQYDDIDKYRFSISPWKTSLPTVSTSSSRLVVDWKLEDRKTRKVYNIVPIGAAKVAYNGRIERIVKNMNNAIKQLDE